MWKDCKYSGVHVTRVPSLLSIPINKGKLRSREVHVHVCVYVH